MSQPPPPSAGWYPDGAGGQRWWDGATWASARPARPDAASSAGASQAPVAGATPAPAAPGPGASPVRPGPLDVPRADADAPVQAAPPPGPSLRGPGPVARPAQLGGPPAGWYRADLPDAPRWWDGQNWGQYVLRDGAVGVTFWDNPRTRTGRALPVAVALTVLWVFLAGLGVAGATGGVPAFLIIPVVFAAVPVLMWMDHAHQRRRLRMPPPTPDRRVA